MTIGPLQSLFLRELRRDIVPQTRGALYDDRGCCVLGVACRILRLVVVDVRSVLLHGDDEARLCAYYGCEDSGEIAAEMMPGVSWRRLGLRGPEGQHRDADGDSLAALNDDRRMSFRDIALAIEADPSAYFSILL